jgi:hypothetical protein
MSSPSTSVAPITVTVQNGVPSQTQVNLSAGQQLIFSNLDSVGYLIEFWTKGNDKHIDVCPLLPANGSVTFQSDPDAPNGKCFYNIESLTGEDMDPTNTGGGGHVIIIGSGNC